MPVVVASNKKNSGPPEKTRVHPTEYEFTEKARAHGALAFSVNSYSVGWTRVFLATLAIVVLVLI
jgi:hypothetical protein